MKAFEVGQEVVVLNQPFCGQVCKVMKVYYPPPPVPPQPTPKDWKPPDQSAVITCKWTRDGEIFIQSFHDSNLALREP